MFKRLIEKYRRFVAFGLIGCINTLVDFGVFTLCSEAVRLTPAWSQAVGYGAGIVCSFILNHSITFADAKKERAAGQALRFIRFVVVNGVSWVISTVLIQWLTDLGIWKYLAKVVVTAITMVINYFGYKIIVFQIREKGEEHGDE